MMRATTTNDVSVCRSFPFAFIIRVAYLRAFYIMCTVPTCTNSCVEIDSSNANYLSNWYLVHYAPYKYNNDDEDDRCDYTSDASGECSLKNTIGTIRRW